jgi:hypothetical protein
LLTGHLDTLNAAGALADLQSAKWSDKDLQSLEDYVMRDSSVLENRRYTALVWKFVAIECVGRHFREQVLPLVQRSPSFRLRYWRDYLQRVWGEDRRPHVKTDHSKFAIGMIRNNLEYLVSVENDLPEDLFWFPLCELDFFSRDLGVFLHGLASSDSVSSGALLAHSLVRDHAAALGSFASSTLSRNAGSGTAFADPGPLAPVFSHLVSTWGGNVEGRRELGAMFERLADWEAGGSLASLSSSATADSNRLWSEGARSRAQALEREILGDGGDPSSTVQRRCDVRPGLHSPFSSGSFEYGRFPLEPLPRQQMVEIWEGETQSIFDLYNKNTSPSARQDAHSDSHPECAPRLPERSSCFVCCRD